MTVERQFFDPVRGVHFRAAAPAMESVAFEGDVWTKDRPVNVGRIGHPSYSTIGFSSYNRNAHPIQPARLWNE